jgi:6,7-dimethyl-8-ribityllumazine synthase
MKKGISSSIDLPGIDYGRAEVLHGELDAAGYRFGIVVSRFNLELTSQLLRAALDCLRRHGADEDLVAVFWVPGAYEVPQAIEGLLHHSDFDAIIALGCVIQGETPHAELINTAVADKLMEIGCRHSLPVINEVVGAYTSAQAEARCRYGEDSRGWYAAAAAVEMATLFRRIASQGGAPR